MSFLRVIGPKVYPFFARGFCTERSGWISVLDDPKMKSPFHNPRRTLSRSRTIKQLSIADVATFANQTDLQAIRELLKPILVERVVGTVAHQEVGNYLERTLRAYGFKTEWDSFESFTTPEHGTLKFRNLIATFNPEIPRRLVLACHYDSKYSRKTSRCNWFFFDGEEAFGEWTESDSIYGARNLAKKWNNSLCLNADGSNLSVEKEIFQMESLVLLDLLGTRYPYPEIHSTYGLGTQKLFERLVETEEQLRRISKLRNIPQIFLRGVRHTAVEDDHLPFLRSGIPVMHLIPVPFPYVWHEPTDDENALDDDVIFNLATIIRVFVARYLGVSPA